MLHWSVFSATKLSVTRDNESEVQKTQQLFLSEQKCLAHMNIELTHCTVFQVLEENCAVDIL